jgi:hypothetical protein
LFVTKIYFNGLEKETLEMRNEGNSSLTRKLARAGGWQVAKRLIKQVPFAGTALAIGLTGVSIKRKGFVKGVVHSALDATPVVGTAKNVIELFTGDLIPDKPESDKKVKR